MPDQRVQCTNCGGWNTKTYYFHAAPDGTPHDFQHQNSPNVPGTAVGPVDQSCPIDGCFNHYVDPPPPGSVYAGHVVFTKCLDCNSSF